MEMILEQHCFTSVEPEFETIGISKGITADERLLLEKYSIYFLPGELLYDDKTIKPVKYVFYPLSDNNYVIGRCEYIGKDSLGRPGNYFFHNYIINAGDLLKINANPVPLIQFLKEKELYKNSLPGEPEPLKISLDIKNPFPRVPAKLNRKSLKAILACIYRYHENTYPVVFHGNGEEILVYLDLIFSLLPYDQRVWLSFDTFAFGVPYSFTVFGLPEDSFYSHSFFSSFEFFLSSGQTIINRNHVISPVVSLPVNLLFNGKQNTINKLFSIYNHLNRHPDTFLRLISGCNKDFLAIFYSCFRKELIPFILKTINITLLNQFNDFIESGEYSHFFNTPGFIDSIAASSFTILHEKALVWILYQKELKKFRLIIQNRALWSLFKSYINSDKIKKIPFPVINIFLVLIKVCRTCYNPEDEKYILKKILLLTKDPFYYNEEFRKTVYKTLKKFPETDDSEILFLRTFFKTSRKKKLSHDFFLFDFTHYDSELRGIFFTFLISAVKKKKIKKITPLTDRLKEILSDTDPLIQFVEQKLTGFLQNRKKTRAFLTYFHLLNLVEKIYTSSRTYKRMKTFYECLKAQCK